MDSFYVHSKMKDGRLNKCKDCVKGKVGKNREINKEKIQAYDRLRGDYPHRVELRKAYAKTERGKERLAVGRISWIERNPEKRSAHIIVGNALRDGHIERLPCVSCGDIKSEAHHEDYLKPLIIIWLCRKCHARHHKEERWKA